jgi:hypothetical protein
MGQEPYPISARKEKPIPLRASDSGTVLGLAVDPVRLGLAAKSGVFCQSDILRSTI